jgi:hypothetical protein
MRKVYLFLIFVWIMVSSVKPKTNVYSQMADTSTEASPEIKAKLDSVQATEKQLTTSIRIEQGKAKQIAKQLQEEVKKLDTDTIIEKNPNLWQRIFSKDVKIKVKD